MDNKFPGKDITEKDLISKIPLSGSKNKKKIVKISKNISFGGDLIPVIAGPNTVENESILFKCCEAMEKNNLRLLRAGIYKPLTFPYRSKSYFELGDKGWKIIEKVKKNFDILIVSEIMEEIKIPIMNEYVDIYQIGARNMQNYPLIVEVAKTNKPILLKRHFGASIRDLLGSAEYALLQRNEKIILCERGIVAPHTHKASSRFLLDLQAVPALQEYSCLPVVVDPSHACFWHKWVHSLTLASLAVGANGLMIEIHPDPRKAAVDPLQAINLSEFTKLINQLKTIAKIFKKKIV